MTLAHSGYSSRCWLNFCQPVAHRLLSYGNGNGNGYDKHLRSQTDLFTSYIQGEVCCGYGSKGTKTTGGDCINIPHLTHVTKGTHKLSAMCGGKGGLGTTSGTTAATVCSKSFFLEILCSKNSMKSFFGWFYSRCACICDVLLLESLRYIHCLQKFFTGQWIPYVKFETFQSSFLMRIFAENWHTQSLVHKKEFPSFIIMRVYTPLLIPLSWESGEC